MNKTAIFLMGPTACGKSDLAIKVANKLPVEIINVDSAQIYIGMDIGTSKPNKADLAVVKHHLIDICHPNDNYSVAKFCTDVSLLLNKIHIKGKIPLLVGGTMLYFYALCFGLNELPPKDLIVRQQIELKACRYGWPYLHKMLAKIDPKMADQIKPNDKQRIQRGLEIFMLTGKNMSSYLNMKNTVNFLHDWNIKYFALAYEKRQNLHAKIETRFYAMLEQGFIEEVKCLLQQNIPLNTPAMRCVGYRQLAEHLLNITDQKTAYQNVINSTRQLAKRQYTWLRKFNNLVNLNFLNAECKYLENLKLIIDHIKC